MPDKKDKFKELVYRMPEQEAKILWNAAGALNDNDSGPILMCRMYLPELSVQEAWMFMLWLRKQPVEDLKAKSRNKVS